MDQSDYNRLKLCCDKMVIVHINNNTHLTTRISCQVCDMWVGGEEEESMIELWNNGIEMKKNKKVFL